jgi:hypothetical protein
LPCGVLLTSNGLLSLDAACNRYSRVRCTSSRKLVLQPRQRPNALANDEGVAGIFPESRCEGKGKTPPKLERRMFVDCAWLRLRATGMPLGAFAQGAYCLLVITYDEVGRCSGVVRERDY